MLESAVAARREASVTTEPTEPTEPTADDSSGSAQGPSLPRRVLPLALVLATFALVGRVAALPLSNSDTFFHLRFGQEFLSDWSLRHPGSPTTLGTADWVPTQWFPQVALAQLDEWFGLPAVAWFSGVQLVVLVLAFYLSARRLADTSYAAPLVVIGLTACFTGISMRPQVISYALIAVTAALWLAVRDGGRTPWVLIPLTWVWASYHGMWPLGIIVGLVAVVGLGLDGYLRGRRLVAATAVPVLSAVAAGITPVGPALYSAVTTVNSRREYFTEWGPPQLTTFYGIAALILLAVPVVVLLRRPKASWTDILLLALAGGLAVYSLRTVPAAAAMLVPLAAAILQRGGSRRDTATKPERVIVWGGAVMTLIVLALATPHTADRPDPTPTWDAASLTALPDGTPVLTSSLDGGYLMWAYPRLDFFLNGYGDVFTDTELKRNDKIESVDVGWDQLLKATGARYAWLERDTRLAYALNAAGWRVETQAGASPEAELLVAPADW